MYAVADDEIAVHLYGESTARFALAGGTAVELIQTTNYPWDGAIGFQIGLGAPSRVALSLRIPHWAEGAGLSINGEAVDIGQVIVDGYARIEREWRDGDRVDLDLPLALRALFANPKVRQDAGRAALMRGPLVYCVEETDNGSDLSTIIVSSNPSGERTTALADLGGAVAVDIPVLREDATDWGTDLYRTRRPERRPGTARFVPYHLWDNREPGEMLVWVQAGETTRGE
jgi:DUF1680 family protein